MKIQTNISVLPRVSKFLETLMYNMLYLHFGKDNSPFKEKFSIRAAASIKHVLLKLVH